jgi:hypothetical protein
MEGKVREMGGDAVDGEKEEAGEVGARKKCRSLSGSVERMRAKNGQDQATFWVAATGEQWRQWRVPPR